MMSNAELAEAIAVTYAACNQEDIRATYDTEQKKLMVAHLKALLSVQRMRAEMVSIPPEHPND